MLTRLKVGQAVRTDGPQTHLVKSGTPTMGGVLILILFGIMLTNQTDPATGKNHLMTRESNRLLPLSVGLSFFLGPTGRIDWGLDRWQDRLKARKTGNSTRLRTGPASAARARSPHAGGARFPWLGGRRLRFDGTHTRALVARAGCSRARGSGPFACDDRADRAIGGAK